MKIQLLGTGSITSSSMCASALINDRMLIDFGNGVMKQMLKNGIDVCAIDRMLITHLHGDHLLDLVFLLFYRREKKPNNTLVIYGPSGLKKTVHEVAKLVYEDFYCQWEECENAYGITYEEFTGSGPLSLKGVEAVNVEHAGTDSAYGYIISDGKVRVGFTGDCRRCAAVDYLAQNVDVLFSDTSRVNGARSHMGVDDLKDLSERYPDTLFVPTHMGDQARELVKELERKNVRYCEDLTVMNV